jgi:hypothetical protein
MATSKKKTNSKKKPTAAKKKAAPAKKSTKPKAKPKASTPATEKKQFVPVQELVDAFEASHPEVKAPVAAPAKKTAWKRFVDILFGK